MENMRLFLDFFVPLYLYKSKIKHGKFLQITGCFLWPHGAGPDLFSSYLRACCLAQVQGLYGGISRAGSIAHPQPSNVPPTRSGAHLPQSRRPDNESLVLQNKGRLSRDKGALFSIKRLPKVKVTTFLRKIIVFAMAFYCRKRSSSRCSLSMSALNAREGPNTIVLRMAS